VQQKKQSGLRRFLSTRLGRVLLIAVTILVVFASYVYVEALLAIPAFLVFGLAIPIWAGQKRARYLALAGLVVILLVAPISTLVITQDIRTPLPLACSASDQPCPGASADALLQNASVTPYTGSGNTNFTWSVTVFPQFAPKGNSTPVNLTLYISTCPGATSTSPPPWCSAGYPFTQITLNISGLSGVKTFTFHHVIGSDGIWDWQMGVYTLNNTTHQPFFQTLLGDATYNGIEGPVVGTFTTTYSNLLPTIYFDDFLFLGGPFFLVLLVYLLFKNRERKRKDAARRAAVPVPPTGRPDEDHPPLSPPSTRPVPSGPAPAGPHERTCPNCNAVVYENEAKCWKCGTALDGSEISTPLPSQK